jgi:PIN domain nuclease of toxin-antitoxin system
MPDAVTDTHALLWYLQNSPQLSAEAGKCFDACQADGGRIFVPTICAVEIIYLSEKGRIPSDSLPTVLSALSENDSVLRLANLDWPVVRSLETISRSQIPDSQEKVSVKKRCQEPILRSRKGVRKQFCVKRNQRTRICFAQS